jgi:hypothetical protein
MADRRQKNVVHRVTTDDGTKWRDITQAQLLAVLMDIRDELQSINATLTCTETQSIPRVLRRISANTHESKRLRKAAAAAAANGS